MKNTLTILFLIFYLCNQAQGDKDELKKIILNPTYKEGFGVVYKKELIIKVIRFNEANKDNSKEKLSEDEYYIDHPVHPDGMQNIIKISASSDDVDKALREAFKNAEKIKVQAICYETVSASGIPSLAEKFTYEDDLSLPSGPGWSVQTRLVLISFKL